MFRRRSLVAGVVLALLAACSPAPPPPNVVVIAIDTLRPDHLGCYGYERDTSPNIDGFAKDAVIFDNAQTAAPWTAPSLLSLMTSLYPSVHGVVRFNDPGQMSERVTTMAEVLKKHGYHTAAFTEGGYAKPQFGLKQGFDEFPLNEGDTPHNHWSNIEHTNRLPQNVARTLDWLKRPPGQPFFLFFHTYQVHGPYRPPEELVRRYRPSYDEKAEHERVAAAVQALREKREISADDVRLILCHSEHCDAGKGDEKVALKQAMDKYGITSTDPARMQFWRDLYDAGIRNADGELKPLFDALATPEIRANTIVVLVSDHGEGFGEHGTTGHGNVLHDEDLRVVFMLRAPGVAPHRISDVVRTVDMMPTVLEQAGLARNDLQLQGRSLGPLLRGQRIEVEPSFSHALSKQNGEDRLWSVREGKWRYVWDKEKQSGELFDLEADPKELTDVAAQNPKVATRMSGLLFAQSEIDARFRQQASGPVGDYKLDEGDLKALEGLGYVEKQASPSSGPSVQPNMVPKVEAPPAQPPPKKGK